MKIAAITTSQVPSSTANSIQAMKACHALAQVSGAPLRLWVPGSAPEAWAVLARHYGLEHPFEIHWLPAGRGWRRYDFAWWAVRQAQQWSAELVYTWTLQAAVLALWRGLPVILELHDLPTGRVGPWLFSQFLRSRTRRRLLVITQALRQKLEDRYLLSLLPEEAQIAPNGCDLARYADLPEPAAARRQLGLPDGLTAVYSGHFYAGRGADLLVGLAESFPQVNFLWVGGRLPDMAFWNARLLQRGIHNVTLTGFVENQSLPLYQAAGEILLMPYGKVIAGSSGGNSAEICSPMKMFDYLATGHAILASDLPVLREVLNPANAVFCPPEELPSWKAALEELIADPERRQSLGAQARQDAARYDWRERARRALEGYDRNYAHDFD